jgi:hypothetical protein
MKKSINICIEHCNDCPYINYDGHYDRCKDSGYDCKKSNKRIIDDFEYSNSNNPNAQYYYDVDKDKMIGDPNIKIPDWCSLPNYSNKNK